VRGATKAELNALHDIIATNIGSLRAKTIKLNTLNENVGVINLLGSIDDLGTEASELAGARVGAARNRIERNISRPAADDTTLIRGPRADNIASEARLADTARKARVAKEAEYSKKLFEDMPTLAKAEKRYTGTVIFDEEPRTFFYELNDRAFSKRMGRLFENISTNELPRGNTYTYVIMRNGERRFGLVKDAAELGVKHVHLANGGEVIVGGEIKIALDGIILKVAPTHRSL
jgi:hypothetical protein